MQLSLFQRSCQKDESVKIRKDKCDSVLDLYEYAHSYYETLNASILKNLDKKMFDNNFLLLCSDLFNDKELGYLSIQIRNKESRNVGIYETFEDPKKKYYQVLMKYLQKGTSEKKKLGAFYTPQDVTENLIDSCIRLWKISKKQMISESLLDPTMGGGDWLTTWFEKTLKLNQPVSESVKLKIFSDTIHGIDIEPVAVICTRVIFWDYFDYSHSSVKFLISNLILGNALNYFSTTKVNSRQKSFDLILGNPPYVVTNLKHLSCYTNDTGNLYAALTEVATELLKKNGKICFVIPLSITCSKSLESLREYVDSQYSKINYSTYGIRPQKMFPSVDQRITVFMGVKKTGTESAEYFSSNGHFQWKVREELGVALGTIDDQCKIPYKLGKGECWPKIGREIESQILKKIKPKNEDVSFLDLISKKETAFPVYYYGNARYFLKAMDYVPYYKNGQDPKKSNSELKTIFAIDDKSQKAIIALMNSTLFYWSWVLFSDCFHVDYKILGNFRYSKNTIFLEKEASKVVKALSKNSFKKKHNENTITEFNVRGMLNTISQLDNVVADYFNFNVFEKKFSLKYASDLRSSNSDDLVTNEEVA